MKTIYFKNLFIDLWKHKLIVFLVVVICTAVSTFLGYKKGNQEAFLSEEEKAEIAEYDAKLAEYDKSIADVEKSIAMETEMIDNLQEYIDQSIYMNLDSSSVKYVTVQYAITYGEGTNAGNVNNALVAFIKDGGLKESVEAQEELKVKYWGEVLTQGVSGNVLSVTLMHYDTETAKDIISVIKAKIEQIVPEIKAIQGEFSLAEIETSCFEKSEVGVVNTQNNSHNNMRSYVQTRADLETKLVSTKNSLQAFIENNKPDSYDKAGGNSFSKKDLMKYAILGAVFGAVLSVAGVMLSYVICDRVKGADTFNDTVFNVIGISKAGKVYQPEIRRTLMDAKLLLELSGKSALAFVGITQDELTSRVCAEYCDSCAVEQVDALVAGSLRESAEELRKVAVAGACVFVAEAGRTKMKDLQVVKEICDRYKIVVIGTVVIE